MSLVVLTGLFFFPLIISLLAVKDIFENQTFDTQKKLIWIAAVILLPLLGAIIYYFFGKPKQL